MNLLIIKKVLENKKLTLTWLSNKLGMSRTNLYKCIEKNRMEGNDVENMCIVLGISPLDIFDKYSERYDVQNNVQIQSESNTNDTILNQQKLISSLEKTIEAQNLTIKLLTEELERKKNL